MTALRYKGIPIYTLYIKHIIAFCSYCLRNANLHSYRSCVFSLWRIRPRIVSLYCDHLDLSCTILPGLVQLIFLWQSFFVCSRQISKPFLIPSSLLFQARFIFSHPSIYQRIPCFLILSLNFLDNPFQLSKSSCSTTR